MSFYKIRHKKTGLYSKGGTYANAEGTNGYWNKSGKTWDTLGKLRAHITSHMGGRSMYDTATDMSDWEVIEYEQVVKEVKPIHEVIDPKKLIQLLKQ